MDSPQRVLTPIPASSPSSVPLNMHARMGPGPMTDIPSEPGTIFTIYFVSLKYYQHDKCYGKIVFRFDTNPDPRTIKVYDIYVLNTPSKFAFKPAVY